MPAQSLPEWFPPMYAAECADAIATGIMPIEWVREGMCIPQVGDFLFDPWFTGTGLQHSNAQEETLLSDYGMLDLWWAEHEPV